MKIRIKSNSLRIRLSRSELNLFAKQGRLEESTDFGSNTLVYAVTMTVEETMFASLEGQKITVHVPEHLLRGLVETVMVGLDHRMHLGSNRYLYILLEKDFKCIDGVVTEDQSDYFENPLKAC